LPVTCHLALLWKVLGLVLGQPAEAVVMAASLCLPQDLFLLPNPAFSDTMDQYLATMAQAREKRVSLIMTCIMIEYVSDTSKPIYVPTSLRPHHGEVSSPPWHRRVVPIDLDTDGYKSSGSTAPIAVSTGGSVRNLGP
jgi:hypothetical protein